MRGRSAPQPEVSASEALDEANQTLERSLVEISADDDAPTAPSDELQFSVAGLGRITDHHVDRPKARHRQRRRLVIGLRLILREPLFPAPKSLHTDAKLTRKCRECHPTVQQCRDNDLCITATPVAA